MALNPQDNWEFWGSFEKFFQFLISLKNHSHFLSECFIESRRYFSEKIDSEFGYLSGE